MTPDHVGLAGRWRVEEGRTPRGDPYTGSLEIARDGAAWRLRWIIAREPEPAATSVGVGLVSDTTLYASRIIRPPDDRDYAAWPGIVRCMRGAPGELLACWYHPSLEFSLGIGRSTNGPKTGLAGRYRADYTADGKAFEPLRKDVRVLADHFAIAWIQGDEVLVGGVAAELSDATRVGVDATATHGSPSARIPPRRKTVAHRRVGGRS